MIGRLLRAAILALAIPGLVLARPGVIVIGDDGGGYVEEHSKFYDRIREAGIPVRIEGICVSACTLVLELPYEQVCVTPQMSFGFHSATVENKPDADLTKSLITRYYPQAIQEWIAEWVKKNGQLTVRRIAYMPAAEVVKRGVYQYCRS